MTEKYFRVLPLLLAAVLLTGCVGLPRQQPEKRFFTLDVARPDTPGVSSFNAVVKLRKFRASPQYEGRGMVYRLEEHKYDSDYYNLFFVAPAELVAEETRAWLDASGLFTHVLDAASPVLPDYYLEGFITSLYGDYHRSGEPLAVIEIQFFLIDAASAAPRIVLQQTYRRETRLAGDGPAALTQAWNSSLSSIMTDLEDTIRTSLGQTAS